MYVCVTSVCNYRFTFMGYSKQKEEAQTNKDFNYRKIYVHVACTDMKSVYACRILLSAGVRSYTDIKDKSIAVAMYSLHNLSVLLY